MEAMFGKKLVGSGGSILDTAAQFGDDVELIGIYFSAHWCPPCRGFTPKLAEFYNAVNAKGKRIEIVFVSHDRNENSFNDYFKEMPWLAIPFDNSDVKEQLVGAHSVNGIPKLVLLKKDGTVKFDDGRGKVMSDPKGESFPW